MKINLLILIFISFTNPILSQNPYRPTVTLKWAPTGLILGSISFQGEYNFGKHSLTAKIGVPSNTKQSFEYDENDAEFNMKATSFLAGYRMYLSKKPMRGLYFEPYFKYVNHSAEGFGESTLDTRVVTMNFTNDYNGFGLGGQLGTQFWIGKRFVIDFFFLGPEINAATSNFKSKESNNALPWTSFEADDAEQEIREFIDKFPFIRNNTDITVDKNNKTISADFKGVLPGYRIGISFGIAF